MVKAKKATFIWNMLGSGMNAAMTMLLTVATAQIVDADASGVLSLAFGFAFIFGCVATFEVRVYQSTDLKGRFTFGDYLGVRCMSCLVSIVACIAMLVLMGYSGQKAKIILFVCLFKVCEAMSDVCQGLCHARGHLEYAGQSLFMRTLSASVIYILILWFTKSPVYAALSMPITSMLYLIALDRKYVHKLNEKLIVNASQKAKKGIVHECWPLAVSSVMTMYILNAEKVQIDRYAAQFQGTWTALFMPAAVINLFSLFVFRPLLTSLTETWNEGRTGDFARECLKIVACISLVSLGVVLVGIHIGIPVLERLYHVPLQGRSAQFALILLGGGLNAVATFMWHMLILMRKQTQIIVGDAIAFLFALIIVPLLVKQYALGGATVGYLLNMLIRAAIFTIFVFWFAREGRTKNL